MRVSPINSGRVWLLCRLGRLPFPIGGDERGVQLSELDAELLGLRRRGLDLSQPLLDRVESPLDALNLGVEHVEAGLRIGLGWLGWHRALGYSGTGMYWTKVPSGWRSSIWTTWVSAEMKRVQGRPESRNWSRASSRVWGLVSSCTVTTAG